MNVFEQVESIIKTEYSDRYKCVKEEGKASGNNLIYVVIEGFTNLGEVAFSLSNFPEAPPSGFCVKNKTISFAEDNQKRGFKFHTGRNEGRCPDPVSEWGYISFNIDENVWRNKKDNEKIIFYLDTMKEKLRYQTDGMTTII